MFFLRLLHVVFNADSICNDLAYGTVGLSLGTPIKNTSLSGDLRTLSKLILVAVMIRGKFFLFNLSKSF